MQSFFQIDSQVIPVEIVDFQHPGMKIDWDNESYITAESFYGIFHRFGIRKVLAIQNDTVLFLCLVFLDGWVWHYKMGWNSWDFFISEYCQFTAEEKKADWKEEGF